MIYKNNKGMTLIEIIVSLGVSMIPLLAFIMILNFVIERIHVAMEQISVETNLATASQLIKTYLGQAVKVKCCRSANCLGGGALSPIPFPTFNLPVTADEPMMVAEGRLDCRDGAPTNWTAGSQNALGLFIRDAGTLNITQQAASLYQGTGLYFAPANSTSANSRIGHNSGTLFVYSGDPAQPLQELAKAEHLVDIEVVPGTLEVTSNDYLVSITYKITARAFGPNSSGQADYQIGSAPTANYKDIHSNVKVVFRNNRLGTSATNGLTSERPFGQIYFFKFLSPQASFL